MSPCSLAFSEQAFRRVQLGQVAIYCRVSTEDQSCGRQERDLRAFAERAGHEIVAVFKETASGAKNDRCSSFAVRAQIAVIESLAGLLRVAL